MKKVLSILIVSAMFLSLASAAMAQEAPKKTILVVSFGTSYNDSRALTLDAIEQEIAKANPDWDVRRAYTAQTIIDKLAQRDNLQIDNVIQAMDKLVADGVKELVIQPTHVMPGYEYDDVVREVTPYAEKFEKFSISHSSSIRKTMMPSLTPWSTICRKWVRKKSRSLMGHGSTITRTPSIRSSNTCSMPRVMKTYSLELWKAFRGWIT